MAKTVHIPVSKFSGSQVVEIIKKHVVGRNLKDINFNSTNLLKGTVEIQTEDPQTIEIEKIVEKLVEVPVEKEVVKEVPLKIVNQVKKKRGATSQYRGVCKKGSKWYSMIQVKGEKHWCGSYFHEIDAAEAYDKKAVELLGEDAIEVVNFPETYLKGAK